ncbi:hypothetical protein [Pseudomonas syringae]|uniref:hypothetical protein n=1 Tax=Pseudomonas syringae TaxID=317 RepID=UPI0013E90C72|nr:hypothetical protein [Pseudomonas syringae]
MNITVHVEWPGGSEDVEFEMPDDSTTEDIQKVAEETLFSLCNFGYSINGEIQ